MSHTCPITGCGTTVADDKLMCFAHWKLVGESLRQKIGRAWSRYSLTRDEKKRLPLLREYLAARTAAIERVQQLGPLT